MNRHPVLEEYWALQSTRFQRAAEARESGPKDFDARIRSVLNAAYAQISGQLVSEGFHFNRRKKWLTRSRHGLIHRIAFTTSPANIPDRFIALYPHFWVLSPELANWLAALGEVREDYVATRHLSDFDPDRASIEHDLGPVETRAAELEDLIHRISAFGLPFFAEFDSVERALASAAQWPQGGFASYEIGTAVAFALLHNRPDLARILAARLFERTPELRASYKSFISGERSVWSAKDREVFAADIARLARHVGPLV